MNRAEMIGRIVQQLQTLENEDLKQLLEQLEDTINDDTMQVITYGANDTEHIQSSAKNARQLEQALEEIRKNHIIITPEHAS
jgi:hypothetical protein